MHPNQRIKSMQASAEAIQRRLEKIDLFFRLTDIENLISQCERNLNDISLLHINQRELLVDLYDMFSSFPNHIERIQNNALNLSITKLTEFSFPVYKLTMPFLLPNKREKKGALKNAITDAVIAAADSYCKKNGIRPFEHATVMFVSSYEGENLNIDNDNKEGVVIINGLIGKFIRDDRASACNTIYYSNKIDKGARTEIYITDSAHDDLMFSAVKRELTKI